MKKKFAAVLIAAAIAVSAVGCSGGTLSNSYIKVNQYKGLEISQVEVTEVSDEYLDKTLQSRMSTYAEEVEVTDRAAEFGDWVNIDYTGYKDEVAFEGGTATGAPLELGSGTYIGAEGEYAGFEDQIVGHFTGEEFDITVQFPAAYQSEELAGSVAIFHIKLNKIYQRVVPELTDEWVLSNSQTAQTVEEYRDEIRKELEASNETSAREQMKYEIQNALVEQIEVKKYPKGEVEEQVQMVTVYYTRIAGLYGMEFGDYVSGYMGMTEEEFQKKANESAENTVALFQAAQLIAKKENLDLSEEEYQEEFKKYAENAGMEDADAYVEQVGGDSLRKTILFDIVMEYLADNCKQVEE